MVVDRPLNLTEEQQAIVRSPLNRGETTLITARAGAGKTSTLGELVRANPGKRFLYLAFNKLTAAEAEQQFPRNCDSKTTHSLSYRHEGYKFKDKGGFYDLNLGDIRDQLGLESFRDAYWCRETLIRFLRSGEVKVEPKHLRGSPLGEEYVERVQELWETICDPASPLRQSHAGYLKLFVDNLCRGAYRRDPLGGYQVILLDEAQDTDPVVERMFQHLSRRGNHALVLVGDSHQAIYEWRGATNAMANFAGIPGVKTFALTGSFRFGPNIASLANQVLDLSSTLARGPDVQGVGGTNLAGDTATLARTNRAILAEAADLLKSGEAETLHLAATVETKGWSPEEPYNFNLFRSVHALWAGTRIKGMHPRICQFQDFSDLSEYLAEAKDDNGDSLDAELSGAVAFVLQYTSGVPRLLDDIVEACTAPGDADFTLSTAHRAKGLEWDEVTLLEDFEILVPQAKGAETGFLQEEVNLLYVAITRARAEATMAAGEPVVIPKPLADVDFGYGE